MAATAERKRTSYTKDPVTGEFIFLQGDESAKFKMPTTKGGDGASLVEAKEVSPAQQRLRRLRGEEPLPFIEKVEIPGDEPCYVRRCSQALITLFFLLAPRDENGFLVMNTEEGLVGVQAAAFYCFTVMSENNRARFFETLEEARAQADDTSPASVKANQLLFDAIIKLNPELWPKTAEATDAKSKGDTPDPLAPAPTS